jgi:hypothetical protein
MQEDAEDESMNEHPVQNIISKKSLLFTARRTPLSRWPADASYTSTTNFLELMHFNLHCFLDFLAMKLFIAAIPPLPLSFTRKFRSSKVGARSKPMGISAILVALYLMQHV